MSGKALTDREIRALKGPCEKAVGGCPGLIVRVLASGVRTFALRYRTKAGDQRSYNLGRFPDETSLLAARERGAELRRRIRAGHDPQADDRAARSATRMVDLLGEQEDEGWYLGTYVKTAGRLGTAKTDHSIATDRSYINKHLRTRKAFLRKRVEEVQKSDLEKIQAEMSAGAWRKVRNILRVVFKHAEDAGAIPPGTNPATRVKATPDRKIERYLKPVERRALEAALTKAEAIGPRRDGGLSPHIVRTIRLLALTGMRLGEVLDMQWKHVDLRHGQILLPTSKTGAKAVPLTPQAIAFLRREHGDAPRVGRVCGTAEGGRITASNVVRAWIALRDEAGIPDVRIHDLRHSWASDAASAGVSLQIIGRVLGHRSAQTTARYAHLHDKAIREGLEKTGAVIEDATFGEVEEEHHG